MSALDFGLLRVQEEAYELSVLQELANSSTVLSPMQVCTSHTHTHIHTQPSEQGQRLLRLRRCLEQRRAEGICSLGGAAHLHRVRASAL